MKNLIIFDSDGTLFDSMPDIYERSCYVFRQEGLTPPSLEEYILGFHFPFEDFFRSCGVKADKEQILKWFYEASSLCVYDLFSDVKNTIHNLQKGGYSLAIVTAGTEERLRSNLERQNLENVFEIYSAENKTESIRRLIQGSFLGERTLYIGDIPHDMKEAKMAGAFPVAILRNGMMKHISHYTRSGALRCIPSLECLP